MRKRGFGFPGVLPQLAQGFFQSHAIAHLSL
jgi:hypothetical protein